MPPPKPQWSGKPKMGKYWNPSQPDYFSTPRSNDFGAEKDDEEASDLSEWDSEHEPQALTRPKFKSKTDEKEWERKQRNREYRVAARREKRNRKADEKKQRKLNATILRRMTKNPEKYNKNTERNRLRAIEMERRRIYKEAVNQAQRLAAIHDPSGKMFNVGPVVTQEDGRVVSIELLEKRAQAQAEKEANLAAVNKVAVNGEAVNGQPMINGVNPARHQQIQQGGESKGKRLSKNQQKKLALLEPRPPPPKPIIPEGIAIPEGEENWISLWELPDEELERRVLGDKRRKAGERRALRDKQKEGKVERRAARDERRKVYREKKLEWKAIKEEEKIQKRKLLTIEQEETKRISIEVNRVERHRAMEVCAKLGFTLENVEGVNDIQPKALGMKGREVDFSILEIGNRPSELVVNDPNAKKPEKSKSNRVNLGAAPDESKTQFVASGGGGILPGANLDDDFVGFNFEDAKFQGTEFEQLNYNHKLRRKLHRAIDAAQIKREILVRDKAKEYCETNGVEMPPEIAEPYKVVRLRGRRILEDGTEETEKQERVKKRLELAEYNKAAKVLRSQAKAIAIEAGLRVFADLTGKTIKREAEDNVDFSSGSSDSDEEPSSKKARLE